MIGRIFSRKEWVLRLLKLSRLNYISKDPGLILIQIDGLSMSQLKKAMQKGRTPFLATLLKEKIYNCHQFYSGLPSNTASVQGELFYGVKGGLPAFRNMEEFEAHLKEKGGLGLLRGGSSYGNVFSAGAKDVHFCLSQNRNKSTWFINQKVWVKLLLSVLYIDIYVRVFAAFIFEFLTSVVEGFKDFQSLLPRVFLGFVREFMVAGAGIDMARGLPIIHLNFQAYEKQVQCRGENSYCALLALEGIDGAIGRIYHKMREPSPRTYDLWIYSDHGEVQGSYYLKSKGDFIESAVERLFCPVNAAPQFLWAVATGPLGHIYVNKHLGKEDQEFYASKLISELKVQLVLMRSDSYQVTAWSPLGKFILPDQINKIFSKDYPFLEEIKEDILNMCHQSDAGQWIYADAGLTKDETTAFAMMPKDVEFEFNRKNYLRPVDLREMTQHFLNKQSDDDFIEFERDSVMFPEIDLKFS